jgi:hypothetical protein
MGTIIALPMRGWHTEGSPFDVQGSPDDESLGNFSASLGHNPLDGRTGDAHLLGGILLIMPVKINQSYCLQLFIQQCSRLQTIQRQSYWLEDNR